MAIFTHHTKRALPPVGGSKETYPRTAAMKMAGHNTQAIYSRYAISDERMLKDAAVKLEQLHMSGRKQQTAND